MRRVCSDAASVSALFAMAVALSACTTVLSRSPIPEDQIATAAPYGIATPYLRIWGDQIGEGVETLSRRVAERIKDTRGGALAPGEPLKDTMLAVSGGGADGAFGAGLLNGWTERGDRPEFTQVTGISTGAIVALFAFLGPEYDDELRAVYTTYTTDDFLSRTFFSALTGGSAISDTRPYRRLIERYVDGEVMERLAEAFENGRTLLIGTTNLDAARPVIWNVAAIAATRHPKARTLVQDIIQASSAVPAAFPPVLIPVVGQDGRLYDEMHVDGGAVQQVMLFSPELPLKSIDQELGIEIERSLFVVINNRLRRAYRPVTPRLVPIAGAAVSTLISGSGTGDIYKIFAIALRDDIELRVVSIPRDFDLESEELFDPSYMQALYDLGYAFGLSGEGWETKPPDYAPWPKGDP